jgi:hypothetical protein
LRKFSCALLGFAVFASCGAAVAHNCHKEPQYSVADGNHSHANGCAVVPILRPRPDSKESDRGVPDARKERAVGPLEKGPIR